jgi:hypothetical protein
MNIHKFLFEAFSEAMANKGVNRGDNDMLLYQMQKFYLHSEF